MRKPLVSVYIVTYNSSEYILDALESVKVQSYKNIELIVSDDCSTDNTVEMVRKWLQENNHFFVNTKLLTVPTNTGVSANVNRARSAAVGKWMKGFAADDMLMPSCIEDNVTYVLNNPDAQIVLSNSVVFFDNKKNTLIQKPCGTVLNFFKLSANEQYVQLVRHNEMIMNPNSQFASAELLKSFRVDERIKFMEDRQFYWYCTKNGVRIHYLDKETVRYRKHAGALTGTTGKTIVSIKYFDSWVYFFYLIRKPEMEKMKIDVSADEKQILWYLIIKYVFKNKGNIFTKVMSKLLGKFLL